MTQRLHKRLAWHDDSGGVAASVRNDNRGPPSRVRELWLDSPYLAWRGLSPPLEFSSLEAGWSGRHRGGEGPQSPETPHATRGFRLSRRHRPGQFLSRGGL